MEASILGFVATIKIELFDVSIVFIETASFKKTLDFSNK